MYNLEGPPAGENSTTSGGFSFGLKLAELEQGASLKIDELNYWGDERLREIREQIDIRKERGHDMGEHFTSRAKSLYESKLAETELDLGEMKEILKDPVNKGRLNLYLTLSAYEAGDIVDKVMTFLATLPPSVQEPILKFVATNPEALPVTLLCSFAIFFAAKCAHYAEKGFSEESPYDSMGMVSVGPGTIEDVIDLFKFEAQEA